MYQFNGQTITLEEAEELTKRNDERRKIEAQEQKARLAREEEKAKRINAIEREKNKKLQQQVDRRNLALMEQNKHIEEEIKDSEQALDALMQLAKQGRFSEMDQLTQQFAQRQEQKHLEHALLGSNKMPTITSALATNTESIIVTPVENPHTTQEEEPESIETSALLDPELSAETGTNSTIFPLELEHESDSEPDSVSSSEAEEKTRPQIYIEMREEFKAHNPSLDLTLNTKNLIEELEKFIKQLDLIGLALLSKDIGFPTNKKAHKDPTAQGENDWLSQLRINRGFHKYSNMLLGRKISYAPTKRSQKVGEIIKAHAKEIAEQKANTLNETEKQAHHNILGFNRKRHFKKETSSVKKLSV